MLFVGITVNLMGMMFSDTGEYSGAAIFCKNQHFIKTWLQCHQKAVRHSKIQLETEYNCHKTTYSKHRTKIKNNRNNYLTSPSKTIMYLICQKRQYLQPHSSSTWAWDIHINIIIIKTETDSCGQFSASAFSYVVTSRFKRYPPNSIVHTVIMLCNERHYLLCIQILHETWTLHTPNVYNSVPLTEH